MSFKAKYNEKTGGWDYEEEDDTLITIIGLIVFLLVWGYFAYACFTFDGWTSATMPWG